MGLFTFAACGDDDGGQADIDATPEMTPDASPDAFVDVPSVTDPEGGQLFYEYIYLSPALTAAFGLPDNGTLARSVGYFINDMQPDQANPQPPAGQCSNVLTGNMWPVYQGTSQEYLDMGEIFVTGPNDNGDITSMHVEKQEPGVDPFIRTHTGPWYLTVNGPNAGDTNTHDALFTVSMTGSDNIKATSFDKAFYLPTSMDLPNFDGAPSFDDTAVASASDDAGFTVNWPIPADNTFTNLPENDVVFAPVFLIDPTTGNVILGCPSLASAGSITITKENLQDYRDTVTALGGDPSQAILSRQYITHHPLRLPNSPDGGADPNNRRRIDFIAVDCWIQIMTVNP